MKLFGIMTTALPARDSKKAKDTTFIPSLTWRLFHTSGVKQGVKVLFFRAEDVDFHAKRVHAWSCSSNDGLTNWKRSYHLLPSVVYENYFLHLVRKHSRVLDVKKQFKLRGIPVFNPALYNKSALHHILTRSDKTKLYMPVSKTLRDSAEVLDYLSKYSTVYLKPINGSGGAGILQLEKLVNGKIRIRSERFIQDRPYDKILDQTELKPLVKKLMGKRKYIIQEGLDLLQKNLHKIDFRVVVHRGLDGEWSSIGIRPKLGKNNSIVTNSHAGGKKTTWNELLEWAKQNQVSLPSASQIERAAVLVARQLTKTRPTLSHLGIDVAVDKKLNIYVLDVNIRPGRDLLTRDMLLKVTDKTVKFANYLIIKYA